MANYGLLKEHGRLWITQLPKQTVNPNISHIFERPLSRYCSNWFHRFRFESAVKEVDLVSLTLCHHLDLDKNP
jgi:hypothetical protein